MIHSVLTVPPAIYWSGLLALLAGIIGVAYLLGDSRPAPVCPYFRKLLVLLPFIGLLLQVESTTQGSAAVLIVQW